MLSPKRTKYRKVQKGILKGKAFRGTKLNLSELQSIDIIKKLVNLGSKYSQINQ